MTAALRRYARTSAAGSRGVIRAYSTSFGLATALLDRPTATGIANVYALVRVADEIVDGTAEDAGVDVDGRRRILDDLEREVDATRTRRFSANPVVHAFGITARAVGITRELTAPFFDSMRADLRLRRCTRAEFDRYVYGSAEVIGLMCLRVFLHRHDAGGAAIASLEPSARALGAAFQKINFLRDFRDDRDALGRCYFPNVPDGVLTDARKADIIAEIRGDLAIASVGVERLPARPRRAVAAALGLFAALTDRLDDASAAAVATGRIRVPDPVKAGIVARAALTGRAP